jgi:hypothetical protein
MSPAPNSRRNRSTRRRAIRGLALILIILAIFAAIFFVIGTQVFGNPSPAADVNADVGPERIDLTLASVDNTDLLVATDSDGNVLRNPDGDIVVYRRASEQVGEIRTVDRGSLDGGQLVLRARPPDVEKGTSASPSEIGGWPVVDRVRVS